MKKFVIVVFGLFMISCNSTKNDELTIEEKLKDYFEADSLNFSKYKNSNGQTSFDKIKEKDYNSFSARVSLYEHQGRCGGCETYQLLYVESDEVEKLIPLNDIFIYNVILDSTINLEIGLYDPYNKNKLSLEESLQDLMDAIYPDRNFQESSSFIDHIFSDFILVSRNESRNNKIDLPIDIKRSGLINFDCNDEDKICYFYNYYGAVYSVIIQQLNSTVDIRVELINTDDYERVLL